MGQNKQQRKRLIITYLRDSFLLSSKRNPFFCHLLKEKNKGFVGTRNPTFRNGVREFSRKVLRFLYWKKSINWPNEVGLQHSAKTATTYHIFFGSNLVPFPPNLVPNPAVFNKINVTVGRFLMWQLAILKLQHFLFVSSSRFRLKPDMRSAILFDILTVVVSGFDRLDVFGIHTDVIRQVSPFGVEIVDQLFFPFPTPSLQLLFTMDTRVKQVMHFVIDQFIGVVFVGKAFVDMKLVFGHPPPKVSSDAGVERGVVLVGQYIDDSLQRHKRLYNIFVVVVRLKIRSLLHSRKRCRLKAGMRTGDTERHIGPG